jgi:hypothetical protein
MKLLQIHSIHSLNRKNHIPYEGITTNSLCFYCTLPSRKEIHQFDLDFGNCKSYTVCRSYCAICYDACDKCFWALSPESNSNIYQLDCEFNEISCIDLSFPCQQLIRLVGISCGPSSDELTIATSYFLGKVNKKRRTLIPIDSEITPRTQYLCVETLHCDYLYATCTNGQSQITLASPCKEILLHCDLDNRYTPLDLAIQYIPHRTCNHLYILIRDTNNSTCVLKCIISSISEKCHPSRNQSCSDLIESIALIEASLAHILNTEGEKLQKVIISSDNFCELIEINNSVNHTIQSVTELEKVLLEKLKKANEINPI